MIKKLSFKKLLSSVVLPLLLAFLLVNIISRGKGGTNALSRFATMRSMIDRGSFNIDPIVEWTFDWSKSPNGHFYSNKAPGPMFFGLPFFLVVDQFSRWDKKEQKDLSGNRITPVSPTPQMLVSYFMQVIPFVMLLFFIFRPPMDKGDLLALGALTFGNTSGLFMNSYFGHGMSSLFVLLTWYGFRERKFALMGFAFGASLLSEYTAGMLLPVWVILIISMEKKDFHWIKPFVAGGLIPGALWIWYHVICFGGVFQLAPQFINPRFQEVAGHAGGLSAIFYASINWDIVLKLLFGGERGLLFTQPWVLVCLPISVFYFFSKRPTLQEKLLLVCATLSFLMLFLMNTSFSGWHGGHTAGPRYLSMGLVLMALSLQVYYRYANAWLRLILAIGVGVSILHQIIIYTTTTLVPDGQHVWGWPLQEIMNDQSGKFMLKFILITLIVVGAIYWSLRNYARTGSVLIRADGAFLND